MSDAGGLCIRLVARDVVLITDRAEDSLLGIVITVACELIVDCSIVECQAFVTLIFIRQSCQFYMFIKLSNKDVGRNFSQISKLSYSHADQMIFDLTF